MIEDRLELSTKQIANTQNVCNKLIWKILKDLQLYPYHIQPVQALLTRVFFASNTHMKSSNDYLPKMVIF